MILKLVKFDNLFLPLQHPITFSRQNDVVHGRALPSTHLVLTESRTHSRPRLRI